MKNLKKTAYLILALFFQFVLQETQSQQIPKKYIAYKTLQPLNIDGKAKEPSWQKADFTENFIDIEGIKKPLYDTQIKMLWDNEYLYLFADLKEPDVWGTLRQRDTVVFYNNDFEIFIDPDGDTHNYYEIEINSLNTVWDLFLTKPYRNNGKVINHWDIAGLRSAVAINGTLNNVVDKDMGWSLEVAIPWKAITEAASNNGVPENDFWRLNFSRVNWPFEITNNRYYRKKNPKTNTYLPEYNWVWSPQGVINMHEPEHWGYVYFSSSAVGGHVVFEIPKDEHIKWFLYELYRKYSKKDITGITVIDDSTEIFGETMRPTFKAHDFGWNIFIESPFTKQILTIKDDGKFEAHDIEE